MIDSYCYHWREGERYNASQDKGWNIPPISIENAGVMKGQQPVTATSDASMPLAISLVL